MAVMLSVTMLCACGKDGEQKTEGASAGSNIIQKSEPQEGDTSANKNFEVQLDKRDEKTAYEFSMADLSFVDTVTGKSVSIGMSMKELEEVAGESMVEDNRYRIYDGLIAQFDDDAKVVSLLVSGGIFQNEAQGTRFVTTRGVTLLTGFDDFVKAYGDLYTTREATATVEGEIVIKPTNSAVRYFALDDKKVEYLGDTLNEEDKSKYEGKIYLTEFMFDSESNQVSGMRVANLDYIGK